MIPEHIETYRDDYVSNESSLLINILEDAFREYSFRSSSDEKITFDVKNYPGPDKYWSEVQTVVREYFHNKGWGFADLYREKSAALPGTWDISLTVRKEGQKYLSWKEWLVFIVLAQLAILFFSTLGVLVNAISALIGYIF